MNADVADAVQALERDGTLSPAQARLFSRVARRELVSVHAELRLLAYAGVLLVASGVGLLVQQNLDRIGPLAIAVTLAIAAAACFARVARQAPPFTWGESASTHLAFDEYVLLLGALLTAALLAWVEAKFTPLGDAWPWHLLLVALVYGLLALRYDSRIVFSLALSTFAAWRGVSTSLSETSVRHFAHMPGALRANAIACGALFLLLGFLMKQAERKAHFEPVAAHMAWIAILATLVSGIGTRTGAELLFTLALLAAAASLAVYATLARRFALLAFGVVAGYIALCALFHRLEPSAALAALWYWVTSLCVLAALFLAHRRLREPA